MENTVLENLKFSVEDSEINRKILSQNWRHRIKINDSFYTPGIRNEDEWDLCFLPNDLKGKSFLDVGSNDGMYSFIAERNNARKVLATDYYNDVKESWDMTEGWGEQKIQLIKEKLNSKIEIKSLSIYDLHNLNETFDIVYCGNVLAWLKSPLIALENLSKCCSETLVIREDIYMDDDKESILNYVSKGENTCYFNGNKEYYLKTLKSLGFKTIEFKKVDEERVQTSVKLNYPIIEIDSNSLIYENPWDDNPKKLDIKKTGYISGVIGNRGYISSLTKSYWVDVSDVKRQKIQVNTNFILNSIKKILGDENYLKLKKTVFSKIPKISNYIIIASR
jgi:SAM-dependent methyltransferase